MTCLVNADLQAACDKVGYDPRVIVSKVRTPTLDRARRAVIINLVSNGMSHKDVAELLGRNRSTIACIFMKSRRRKKKRAWDRK